MSCELNVVCITLNKYMIYIFFIVPGYLNPCLKDWLY